MIQRIPFKIFLLIVMGSRIISIRAEETPETALAEVKEALQSELSWPVELQLRKTKTGKTTTLVASLTHQGEDSAPWELDELYVPLYKIGRVAALRIPEATQIEITSFDPKGQQIVARVAAQTIQQLHDQKISTEAFKANVIYKVDVPTDVTAESLYQSALATVDGDLEIELLRKAVTVDDNHLQSHALLGFLIYFSGDVKTAIKHLQSTINLDPHYLEPHWFMISALRDTEAWEPMMAEINQFETLIRNQHESIIPKLELPAARAKKMSDSWTKTYMHQDVSQIKCAYLVQSSNPEAATALKSHLKNWPKDAVAHYLYGVTLLTKNDSSAAQKEFESAVTLNPRSGTAWRLMGYIHGDRKKFKEEVLAFRCALTAGDTQADNYIKLGYAYAQLGEWYDCKHVSAEGLSLHPNEAGLRTNFKEAHKQILSQKLTQKHPFYPLTAPLDLKNSDLNAAVEK